MSNLSSMIDQAFGPGANSGKTKTASYGDSKRTDTGEGLEKFASEDIEKIASTLEYIGTTGVENLLEKSAMSRGAPMNNASGGKEAGGSPAHNMNTASPSRSHVYTGASSNSPPMKGGGNSPSTNMKKAPGDGKGANTAGYGKMTHPGLKSNEAAINVTKADKTKLVSPDLKKVLDTIPFADPVPKNDLKNAKSSGEANTHSGKSKTASEAVYARQAVIDSIFDAEVSK